MFWKLLFGILFFVPIFGMAMGAAFGALGGKLAKGSIGKEFQDQVRVAMQPGTSALFMIVEQMTTDKALDGLSKFGGGTSSRRRSAPRTRQRSRSTFTGRTDPGLTPTVRVVRRIPMEVLDAQVTAHGRGLPGLVRRRRCLFERRVVVDHNHQGGLAEERAGWIGVEELLGRDPGGSGLAVARR
ncbi:MAG: DUF1269 domain-containing protein [Microthrixaceae bacterium]|nr:DUF1269 domain-containing protein [Microthrixaceae bacterium]